MALKGSKFRIPTCVLCLDLGLGGIRVHTFGRVHISTYNNLNLLCLVFFYFVQVKQSAIALVLSCSIPTSIGELESFHGIGVLSVVSICYQHMSKLQVRDILFVDQPIAMSKGVAILELCSMFSYNFDNAVPIFLCPFFSSFDTNFIVSFVDSETVHSYLVSSMQDMQSCKDVPHKHQLVMDCTTLHNQIRSFSSLFKHRYEDPYLVDANEIVHEHLRVKWCYNQFWIHWYIPWLKILLVSSLHLHKRHVMWYARMKVLPEVLHFLQSVDLRANCFQEAGNDTNM